MTAFDLPIPPRARLSDPSSSHFAAASVRNVTDLQKRILDWFQYHEDGQEEGQRGLTDTQLIESMYASGDSIDLMYSASGIRTRRKELVNMGRLKDSGRRVRLVSGRESIVWCLA